MKTGILPLLCTDLSMLIADRYARRNGVGSQTRVAFISA